jgi:hypothetical protein
MNGAAGLHIKNEDLNGLAVVLERAASVTRNEGEDFQHIESWKYACARNYKIVTGAIRRADERIEAEIAKGVSAGWPSAAAAMVEVATESGLAVPAEDGDGGRTDLANALAAVLAYEPSVAIDEGFFDAEEEEAERLAKFREAIMAREDGSRIVAAATARIKGFERADAILHETVVLPVYRLPFDRIPERVSGGFVRDLLWMMKDVPEGFGGELADEAVGYVRPEDSDAVKPDEEDDARDHRI